MKGILASFFTRQTLPPDTSEGLPYWTFWFLLCIILLLIMFIFLRDKDLRRRINLFFFGAKKKLIKMRLQARLKRECRKKEDIIRSLGIKIWEDKITIPGGEKIHQELAKLEKHEQELEKESKEIRAKITGLENDQQMFTQKHNESILEQESARKPTQVKLGEIKDEERILEVEITQKQKELDGIVRGIDSSENENEAKLEDLQKQRNKMEKTLKGLMEKRLKLEHERKDHQEKIEEFDKKLKKIEEDGKKRLREFHREIREWKKSEEKLHEKIGSVEHKKEPLFTRLGKHTDETRASEKELSLFYSQIDRSSERIDELEQQIKNL